MSVADLTASVLSPSKKTEEAQIIETEESNYSIRFVPRVNFCDSTYLQQIFRKPESTQ